jgi:integrase
MRANRKTKVQPSQVDRSKRHPKRKPGLRYVTGSYAYAIRRACEKAEIEAWSPNRLRHTTATALRSKFGIEASRTVLGHASPATTLIYAERDLQLAASVMQQVG